jgi:hypothetical protein
MGDLKQDSKSNVYDEELMAGVINFKKKRIQSQQISRSGKFNE